VSVSLADAQAGAAIFFTTDGSTPTSSSVKYLEPLQSNATVTVRALAIAPGKQASSVVSATYTCALTKADFAVLLSSQFRLPTPKAPIDFPDVPRTLNTYPEIEAAASFLNPQLLCPNCALRPEFYPTAPISRQVATLAYVRILLASGRLQLLSAADSATVLEGVPEAAALPKGAKPYFATAVRTGLLAIDQNHTLGLASLQSREEALAHMADIQKRMGANEVIQPQ